MDNKLIVKEPEEMLFMRSVRGSFSEGALKLSAYLIAILEKDKTIYKISIKEYLNKFDKKIGNYNYLYNVAKELTQKQFEIKDRFNERFAIFNFVSSVSYYDGILEVEFSQKLLTYLLEIKEKYLKYNIENIMNLSSKYAIKLYKILKDIYEKHKRYKNKTELELSIQDLREILEIPRSYRFHDIKRQILETAKTELEKYTDILFNYEIIKSGRKISAVKFNISINPKKIGMEKLKKSFIVVLNKAKEKEIKFYSNKYNKELIFKEYFLTEDNKLTINAVDKENKKYIFAYEDKEDIKKIVSYFFQKLSEQN